MRLTIALIAAVLFCSCATLVNKAKYPVTVDSDPRKTKVVITDRFNQTVFKGNTPALVYLHPHAGPFRKAIYKVTISKPGYEDKVIEIRATLNGWYVGNMLGWGLPGAVIDSITGAMYRISTINSNINEELETVTLAPALP